MNTYSFIAHGHKNILATHKTTLEITKEKFLTKRGDCIIGVNANFELKKLRGFIKNFKVDFVEVELKVNGLTEKIKGKLNKNFDDENSIVIRKSNFISPRTLVFSADKSARDLSREYATNLANSDRLIYISIRLKNIQRTKQGILT